MESCPSDSTSGWTSYPPGEQQFGDFRSALARVRLSLSCPARLLHTCPFRPARHCPAFRFSAQAGTIARSSVSTLRLTGDIQREARPPATSNHRMYNKCSRWKAAWLSVTNSSASDPILENQLSPLLDALFRPRLALSEPAWHATEIPCRHSTAGSCDVQNQNVIRATSCPFLGCVKSEVGLVKPHPDVGCPAAFLACGCVGAVSDGFATYVRLKMLKNSARTDRKSVV